MALLDIIKYPAQILKRKAGPVDAVDAEIRKLMDDMLDTMYAAPGIGLAAPQVGLSKRVIVVDINRDPHDRGEAICLANPEITSHEGEIEFEEGCLSVPDFLIAIPRASNVTVKGIDRDNNPVIIEAEGLLAVALQHEIDHLDGRLIIDRASFLKREFYKKQVKKQRQKALAKAGAQD